MLRLLPFLALAMFAQKRDTPYLRIPRLAIAPVIDADLSEWRDRAHSDGLWDLARLRESPWYDSKINRLTVHGNEPRHELDLAARYFTAWDDESLYLGAEVADNVNDVTDPAHEPKRWYYKDAVCWFIEAPRLPEHKKFGEADNAFCFVIDTRRPPYGAWWRHGAPGKTYIEEPLTAAHATYAIRRTKTGFTLEARVKMANTLGVSSPKWRPPQPGDTYGMEIVHTDPDGGDYGGHFLIYGRGDDDSTWGRAELTGPIAPVERKPK
ncbi:MAG: hypothetical protein FJW30_23020 [Acidobacteria bacterium]|nr:hypothetical protein [Acidobacteriota bacterium]